MVEQPATEPTSAPAATPVATALTFMRTHAAQSLTAEAIAMAAGATPRLLHEQFRRQCGVSPLQHLRHLRLDSVHQELRNATPTASIAGTARRWGFAHLGRFTAASEERFGESPATTLTHAHGTAPE